MTCETCQHWLYSRDLQITYTNGPEGYCLRIPILSDSTAWLPNGDSEIRTEYKDCLAFSNSSLLTKRAFSCAMHKAKSP